MAQASRRKRQPHRPAYSADVKAYYMSGANATVPDLRYKQALRLKKNHAVVPPVKEKKKKSSFMPKLRTIGIIFLLSVLVTAQYTAVQTMGYRVNEVQKKLDEYKVANEQLAQEYAALGDLSRIEKKANKELGMVHPQKVIAYHPTHSVKSTDDSGDKGGDST